LGKTNIEWTATLRPDGSVVPGYSFNPWYGCQKISPACANCYAEAWAKRAGRDFSTPTRTTPANWREPLKWNREAQGAERRPRVFCASLADVFDNRVPAEWRDDLWALIRATPNLDWLIVTKRIGNAARMLPEDWGDGWPNVWLIATVVNQQEADRDIPKLLQIPAAVHGLSIEPLLGKIQLLNLDNGDTCASECCGNWRFNALSGIEFCGDLGEPDDDSDSIGNRINWVIVGGESGAHARPMNPAWVRSIRDQCQSAKVPFFFKQWGEFMPSRQAHEEGKIGSQTHPWGICQPAMCRVGKKLAGRTLDGRTFEEYPDIKN